MTEITAVESTTPDATPSKPQSAAIVRKSNKYSDARLAKKKKRRAAHRATIKRSNANG